MNRKSQGEKVHRSENMNPPRELIGKNIKEGNRMSGTRLLQGISNSYHMIEPLVLTRLDPRVCRSEPPAGHGIQRWTLDSGRQCPLMRDGEAFVNFSTLR